MEDILPLFKSHYSIGRSILTLSEPEDSSLDSPDSILSLVKEAGLNKFFLIEDNMSGFLEAYVNSKKEGMSLVFGLRLSVCLDMTLKDEDTLKETCKYLIIVKNNDGYKKLIKIFTSAAKDGFYYTPRIDFKHLNQIWSETDLQMAIPFYDSFIFNNVMGSAVCIPDFQKIKPIFFIERNNLPFDPLIEKRVKQYCEDKYETVLTKSIFYKNKKDFKAYLTARCLNNRTTLSRPKLDHMSSDEFCFESWQGK